MKTMTYFLDMLGKDLSEEDRQEIMDYLHQKIQFFIKLEKSKWVNSFAVPTLQLNFTKFLLKCQEEGVIK